ncbi:MAG: hypothetical protein FD155_3364 [Bacteroidetes bacterium]|nr:MAG: hypothetical protein FD155_3364 [Bacteroidota bacterium]
MLPLKKPYIPQTPLTLVETPRSVMSTFNGVLQLLLTKNSQTF